LRRKALMVFYYIKVLEGHGWFVWPLRALLFVGLYVVGQAGMVIGSPDMPAKMSWLLGALLGCTMSWGGVVFYPLILMISESVVKKVAGYLGGIDREARRLEAERLALLEAEEAHGGALTIVGRDQDDEGGRR
jgi:hypothetical protein